MPPTSTLQDALARLDDAAAALPGPTRPAALEHLGLAVAHRLAVDEVDLILSWDRTDDATLGHVVARELAVDEVLIVTPAEGQLAFDRPPRSGARIALVGIAFSWVNSVRAPIAFASGRGARVVRVVAFVNSSIIAHELDDASALLDMSAFGAS